MTQGGRRAKDTTGRQARYTETGPIHRNKNETGTETPEQRSTGTRDANTVAAMHANTGNTMHGNRARERNREEGEFPQLKEKGNVLQNAGVQQVMVVPMVKRRMVEVKLVNISWSNAAQPSLKFPGPGYPECAILYSIRACNAPNFFVFISFGIHWLRRVFDMVVFPYEAICTKFTASNNATSDPSRLTARKALSVSRFLPYDTPMIFSIFLLLET
ncbi:hypothetical protein EDD85DRAFT_991022 [Armillaria nabsnona]|nr:hypothetical protein EDD85DRAFT_991022 [Armillaria nabsnona]